jgi:hypothetical protein
VENFTLFGQVGRVLFGSHWQSDLARALDVNLRTLRRWGAGQEEPPPGVWRELEEIAGARGAELALLVNEIHNRACEKVIPAVAGD